MPNYLIMTETILNKKRFHVVQFLEKPYENIEKYVCVPNSWISLRNPSDTKVYVSYPKDEKPSETRRRVRTRAALDETWPIYTAVVKFGSNNYFEADNWASMTPFYELPDEGDSDTEGMKLRSTRKSSSNSKTDKPQLTVKLNENPQKPMIKVLIKQPVQSKPEEDLNRQMTRPDEAAQSTNAIVNNACTAAAGCSKSEQSIKFRDDQLIQSDQTEKTAAVSNGGKSCEHEPSMSLLDEDEPSGVINSDQEIQPESITEHLSSSQISSHASQQPCQPETVQETQISLSYIDNPLQKPPTPEISVRKSKGTKGHSQKTHLHSNTTAARTIAPKPPYATNQFSQSFQHIQSPTVTKNSFLNNINLQEIPGIRLTEVTRVNQIPHLHDITSSIPSTSQHLPKNRSGKPSLSVIKKPASKKKHVENIVRNLTKGVQNSTNERDQFSTSSEERQAPLNTQNYPQSQDVHQVPGMHAGQFIEGNEGNGQRSIFRGIAHSAQKVLREPEMLVRGSNELNRNIGHRSFHQNTAQNTFPAQNISNLPHHHQSRCFSQQSHERNNCPSQKDYLQYIAPVQDMLRRPNTAGSINQRAFAAHDRPNPANQHSDALSRSRENEYQQFRQYCIQQERLRHELLRRSTETNHTDHGNHPQNIEVGVSVVQNPSNVSTQFHQGFELTQQRQLQLNHQYSQRDPRLSRSRVGISMKTNSKSQSPGLQGVTTRTPPSGLPKASNSMGQTPTAYKQYLLEDSQTQANRSTEQNNIHVAAVPQNITTEPSLFMHNDMVPPTCSCHQLHEIQLTPVRQNHVYQDPRTQKLLVDQSTETNFTMKRIYCDDDIIRSSANSSRLVDSACQTDESLIEEPLPTYQEVVSDSEMSAGDAPVEIVNDVICRGEQVRFVQREHLHGGDIYTIPYVDASVTPAHTHRLSTRGGAAEPAKTTCFRSATMPRIYAKKGNRTGELDEDAMKEIFDKTRKSAQKYGGKSTTLESRLAKCPKQTAAGNEDNIPERVFCSKFTSNQVFTIEEETLLNKYITDCSEMHYGLTIVLVKKLAYEFAKANKLHYPPSWDHNKMAGNEWLDSFRRRNTNLSLRRPENNSAASPHGINKPVVNNFFENLEKVLIKYKFTADRIYNFDELGISTVLSTQQVLVDNNQKQIGDLVSAERGVTFGGIISAIGNTVPPLFVFPEVHFKDHFITGAPEGSLGVATKSGRINSSIFLEVLKHIKKIVFCSKDNPILLLVDTRDSHIAIEVVDYARDNGIVYLSFPPHTKHRLQPLDVGVFGPFKAKLKTIFNDWHVNNPGKTLNIYNIPKLAKIAYFESFNGKNITSAFEKTGIWPFNKLAISDDDFAPTQVYHSDTTATPDVNIQQMIPEEMDQQGVPPRSSSSLLPQPVELAQEHYSSPDVSGSEILSAEIQLTQQDQSPTSAPSSPSLRSPACSPAIGLATPEMNQPYPKVNRNAPEKSKKGKLSGKSRIYTDTPEKNRLEEIKKGKKMKNQDDERKQRTTEMKRALHLLSDTDMISKPKKQKKSTKTYKPKRQKKTVSEDEDEIEGSDDFVLLNKTPVLSKDIKEGTFILVKFEDKKIIEYHVAQVVTKYNPTKYKVSFLNRYIYEKFGEKYVRRWYYRKTKNEISLAAYCIFVFPDIEDEEIVHISEVVCILPQPKTGLTARTANRYTFGNYLYFRV